MMIAFGGKRKEKKNTGDGVNRPHGHMLSLARWPAFGDFQFFFTDVVIVVVISLYSWPI